MIHVIQNGDVYELTFKYDELLISHVKNVPGRIWHSDRKKWTIPKEHLGWFLNEIKGTIYENCVSIHSDEHLNENATLDSTSQIPDVDISDMHQYVMEGGNLYKHQIDFLKYAKSRKGSGFLLADEMGLGKTLEVMNYALYQKEKYGYKHCLIICCVNSAKFSWKEDIEKHTRGQESAYILGTRKKRNGDVRYSTSGSDKTQDLVSGHMYSDESAPELPYFLITNIESLRAKVGKKYILIDEIVKLAWKQELAMIAIDEVHKNMSPKSAQGKAVLKIKQMTGSAIEWIPMTGTPIVNKPTDVFTPLKLIGAHSIKSYYEWCQTFVIYGGYGDHEVMGYKNIPQLKTMLQHNMLRRLKKDVLDLPDKIYHNIYVENTPTQTQLYSKLQVEMQENEESIIGSMNPLAAFLRLRQVNGSPELVDPSIIVDSKYLSKNAKLVELMRLLEEIVERDEKVVVFSNWVEPLKTLYKFVAAKYKTTCFTGTMSEDDRQKHKRVFINNPDYKVMLGTIGALGVNHTLTVATNVIFYDEPWTPGDKIQAEDRCHRIGSKFPLNIYTLLTVNTVDDAVHRILGDKSDISNYIVDGKLNLRNNPELFEKLLGTSGK